MPERERDETFEERLEAGRGERGVDVGQKEVQARKDVEDALGYIPSDGASLGGDVDLDPEELAEHQAEVNKAFTMPPDGLAAEKPTPPHSAEAASSDETETDSGPSKDELLDRAAELDIAGRSSMNKAELAAAVAEAESNQ